MKDSELKKALLGANLISKKDFESAEEKAKKLEKNIEDILIEKNLITEEDLAKKKAEILKTPFVDLKKEIIPLRILEIIPEPLASHHNIVAFKQVGKELWVAMLDPDDLQTIEFIEKKTDLKVLPHLTTQKSLQNIIKQYAKTLEAEFEELIKKKAVEMRPIYEKLLTEKEEGLRKIAEDVPIIRIVDILTKHAILENATDIHIEPMEKELVIRYRIDGILREALHLPPQLQPGVVARIKILSNLKLDEHRLPQDGRFKIETEQYKYSFRISILPVFYGEKIVIRLLPESVKISDLEQLGLRSEPLKKVERNIKRPEGMILVVGPTGCGKTTTLYTILNILNVPGVNISTMEDPIEYCIEGINQTQVKPEIGLTFANGLRSLLRQDPDILMVGEIRDNETASLAINAALTGHLVLSTLHTNSAVAAFPRLLDMKAEGFLIATTTNLIIAQRLVRRLCDEKEKYTLKDAEIEDLKKEFDMDLILEALKREKVVDAKTTWKNIEFFKPKQTAFCPEGYKGRIGIYEALEVTEPIKEMIVGKATADEIEKQAKKEGMLTMVEDGFIKAVQGITTIEEILRVTRE